jgi:hypothetical protein
VKNRRFCYRQGVVLADAHPILLKGQVVEIIDESESFYRVRVNITSQVFNLLKKDILVN